MPEIEKDFVKEVVGEDGVTRRYDENGKFHSLHSPAVASHEYGNFWFNHGKFHRLDGPAAEGADGGSAWYYKGCLIGNSSNGFTQDDFNEYMTKLNESGMIM